MHDENPGQELVPVAGSALSPELAQAAEEASRFMQASRSPATLRAYASDWRDFQNWCARELAITHLFPKRPVPPATIALYLVNSRVEKAVAGWRCRVRRLPRHQALRRRAADSGEPLRLRLAPRCGAPTRNGGACRSPAIRGPARQRPLLPRPALGQAPSAASAARHQAPRKGPITPSAITRAIDRNRRSASQP
jgi:hypothetical protein